MWNDDSGSVYDQSGLDLTTVLQTLINTGGDVLSQRISMQGGQAAIPDYGAQPVNFPMVQQAGAPILGGIGAALGLGLPLLRGAAGAAIGVIRSVGGKILGWVLPSGRRVSRKAGVSMAKQFGLLAAAGALGASVEDMAQAVLDEETKPRRGRGISAAQIRITTRTIGKLERAHRQVARAARSHIGKR